MNGKMRFNFTCNPMVSAVLFVFGAVFCLMLDIIGIMPLAPKSVLNSPLNFSQYTIFVLPLAYIVMGIVVGIVSKTSVKASIYGASVGQCQTILPLIIYYFILHEGAGFEIWLRAFCGLPLSLSFAGIAFSVKSLLKNG